MTSYWIRGRYFDIMGWKKRMLLGNFQNFCCSPRLVNKIVAFVCFVSLAGCEQRQITPANVDQTIQQFQAGKLMLSSSISSMGGGGIFHLSKYLRLAAETDWPTLSKTVIKNNSDDNLNWFFLGLSAGKMGYTQAAATYYTNSINEPYQFCNAAANANDPNHLSCYNLVWPDLAERYLHAVEGP